MELTIMYWQRIAIVFSLAVLSMSQCATWAADFTGLGYLGANDLTFAFATSANGKIVVGTSVNSDDTSEAFRWLAGSMEGLGDLPTGLFRSGARDVSEDGSVVVGIGDTSTPLNPSEAFRWTQAGGMQGLGVARSSYRWSEAWGVSADGSVVVGITGDLQLPDANRIEEAFRWTESTGMVGLGDLPGGESKSGAIDVSSDGSVVVGSGISAQGAEAFRWTAGGGMVGLGDLPGGDYASTVTGVSADGSVVVGAGATSTGVEAFRWTASSGMVGIGYLDASDNVSVATAASGDGSLVVGWSGTATARTAIVWDDDDGMRDLGGFLTAAGVDLTGWTLNEAWDISPGGSTVVGVGLHNGVTEAWAATLFTSLGDFDRSGVIDAIDIDLLTEAIRVNSTNLEFDVDGSGAVETDDLSFMISDLLGTRFGDANLDMRVDSLDFAAWDTNRFQPSTGWARGDFNGDGGTDVSDFNLWNTNRSPPAASETVSQVPEPGIWQKLGLGVVVLLPCLHRRRKRRTQPVHGGSNDGVGTYVACKSWSRRDRPDGEPIMIGQC